MHKDYVSKFKFAAAFGAALLLAACGDSGDKPAADDAQQASAEADAPVVDIDSKTEGTWGPIVYGDPNAPVEIHEFASLTCPHCATFANNYFPKLKEQLLDTGKAKLVYHNYIMNRIDIVASAAARCGDAATTQKLMKVYFARQGDWARSKAPVDELASIARRAGISRTEFDRCVSDDDMLKHLMSMTQDAVKKHNITLTPSFMVDGELMEFSSFDEALEKIAEAVDDAS
ncbi:MULTISPECIES: thioredoxin domain-containing protein [Kordiimonas]|jgi:protein-disulfide isomerase|nr:MULTISPECIES: thioredoxin domain-containing protein [Kordiimonas]